MKFLRGLRGPTIDDDGVLAVMYHYHLDPQPQQALAAFERMVKLGIADPGDRPDLASTAWVFGRIAGRNPEILPAMRRALARRKATASSYGRMVLETAEAGEAAGQRLLDRPLTSASDIAFLGAEVVVTGSLDPFVHMLDALGAPDLTRRHLEQWLRGESGEPASPSVSEGIEILATDYHIVARTHPPSVLTVSDCDLMVMIHKPFSVTRYEPGGAVREYELEPGGGMRQIVRRQLPVGLDSDEEESLRIKVSAALELGEALNEHEALPTRVESELVRRHDPRVRIGLLELLAGHALPKFRIAEGIAFLERILEIDPYRDDLVTLIGELRRDPLGAFTDGQL